MKTKKSTFAMIIAVSMLLAIFSGCSESVNDEILNGDERATQPVNVQEHSETEREIMRTPVPFGIEIDDFTDLEAVVDEILEQIEIAEEISEGDEEYGIYQIHRISDIEEFYVPTIEIDGFELRSVEVLGGAFLFYYVPTSSDGVGVDRYGAPLFYLGLMIQLQIGRTDGDVSFAKTIEEFAEVFNVDDLVIRDGFIYVEDNNLIAGLMGETWFDMRVPYSLNNFETLRDLATQVVDSAELVVVDS